jgi:hypothetical protein
VNILQVSDTDLKSVRVKKIIYFGHLSECFNTCRTSVIRVSDTNTYRTPTHIEHHDTPNHRGIDTS